MINNSKIEKATHHHSKFETCLKVAALADPLHGADDDDGEDGHEGDARRVGQPVHRAEEARLRREEPLGEGVGGEVRRVGGRQAVHARRHLVLGQEALRVGHQVQAYKTR